MHVIEHPTKRRIRKRHILISHNKRDHLMMVEQGTTDKGGGRLDF